MKHEPTGGPNPDAPPELSQFAFLIGSWRADGKLKTADGTWKPFTADWTARYILDGYVIADEFHTSETGSEFQLHGATFRSYDASRKTWVMKFLNARESTWLDLGPENLGGVEVTDDAITFMHRVEPDGLLRVRFENFSANHFSWRGEFSSDGGNAFDEIMVIEAHRLTG